MLLRGSNASWLFPGEAGNSKTANMFSTQITERIEKATGLRITVHQFRHAAAAFYLKHHPGDYETVRRFLGHRNIQTTINFYCGLQTMQATEEFGKIIRQQIKFEPEDAEDALSSMDTCHATVRNTRAANGKVRSLPIELWPKADRDAWVAACQPARRLKRGGSAAHLKPITRDDLARRYGYFLDFLNRRNLLQIDATAAAGVTPGNVDAYIAELKARVGSVTVYGSVYKLRRASAAHCPRPRLRLACRDREGPRAGHATALEVRSHGPGRGPGRSRADLDP